MSRLTQQEIDRAKPQKKKYKLWDEGGVYVLVRPSGVKSYYLLYTDPKTGRKKDVKIAEGDDGIREARERAKVWRGLAARGEDPAEKMKPKAAPVVVVKDPTVGELRDAYAAYLVPLTGATPPVKSGRKIVGQIDAIMRCPGMGSLHISEITATHLQQYIDYAKQQRGNKEITINDRLRALHTMWFWGVRSGLVGAQYQPITYKRLQEKDSSLKVRYLTPDERARLYAALEEREKKKGVDYLRVAVLIANYTGIRRGALLKMKWGDVTQHPNGSWTLHLDPMSAKSTRDYDLPLSDRVVAALKEWRDWSAAKWGPVKPSDYVIRAGAAGLPLTEIKKAWLLVLKRAGIENFRWHDLRHDYASQLVMAGVSIEQVKALMTHETIQMTLRYAHLAPGVLQAAANRLNDL